MIRSIAAIDARSGLADGEGIPWQGKLPADVEYFRAMTAGAVILMGHGTYAELAEPLAGRRNVVVTSKATLRAGFEAAADPRRFLASPGATGDVWVIGGAALFAATLDLSEQLYLTQLDRDFHCTKFFPPYSDRFERIKASPLRHQDGIGFRFEIWQQVAVPVDPSGRPGFNDPGVPPA